MATVRTDLIRDSKLTITPEQVRLYRTFFVDGVSTTTDNYLPAALATAGIPAYGAPHPTQTSLLANDFEALPVSENQVIVIVTYQNTNFQGTPLLIEYDSTLVQEQTNEDKDLNTILVYYWTRAASVGNINSAFLPPWSPQPAIVPVLRPLTTKTVSFYHTGANDAYIQGLRAGVGKINSDVWDGGAASTWLCTNVKTNQAANSTQVKVQCQFVYKAVKWTVWATATDPTTGAKGGGPLNHKDLGDEDQLVNSNGWRGVRVYDSISFAATFGF